MRKLSALFILLIPFWCEAASVQVNGLRAWPAPDNTRLVFDISDPVEYKLFRLPNPERLVIDFKDARLASSIEQPEVDDRYMKSIRMAPRNKKDLRIVLDLLGKVEYKSFLLKPYQEYGHRLVIDVHPVGQIPNGAGEPASRVAKKVVPETTELRDLVIAIDAGHGGEDPGARGYRGALEKDVVFAIAKQLETLIRREPGMKPVMVREGDYFVGLRKRTLIARNNQADLFVSIHADAFKDKRVNGTSVYILSSNGATSEAARWLAEKENASDLIGGVSLDDKDNLLASVLLDLSQTATIEASYDAGSEILRQLKPIGKLHKTKVQQAGFVVLKSPDIPSILVETAFISNPDEERKLSSPRHQANVAHAILGGIRGYFAKHAPPGTMYATRKHIIARGDTLSDIAQRYQVSISSLRNANQLKNDSIIVGQVIRIPGV